jgi:serine/threonine-protein kinase
MVGTLKYMAPEQVQGQKIDSRADLFSVGVVLYQLLTDQRPFDGDNDFSIIHAIIGHEPPPPSTVNARLPTALDAVVARALAKSRDERFATARDFAVALQAAIRRAEDQTVRPAAEPAAQAGPRCRGPLTAPGTLPPGTVPGGMTVPSVGGSPRSPRNWSWSTGRTSRTPTDPEDLHGFLEQVPDRHLRRPGAAAACASWPAKARPTSRTSATSRRFPPGPRPCPGPPPSPGRPTSQARSRRQPAPRALNTSGTSTMFPDYDATRARGEAPVAEDRRDGTGLKPSDWVDQEYTRTRADAESGFPATVLEPTPQEAAAIAAARRAARQEEDDRRYRSPASAQKAADGVLVGVGALAVAGIVLALVMGRGGDKPVAAVEPCRPAARLLPRQVRSRATEAPRPWLLSRRKLRRPRPRGGSADDAAAAGRGDGERARAGASRGGGRVRTRVRPRPRPASRGPATGTGIQPDRAEAAQRATMSAAARRPGSSRNPRAPCRRRWWHGRPRLPGGRPVPRTDVPGQGALPGRALRKGGRAQPPAVRQAARRESACARRAGPTAARSRRPRGS